jgi:hypothetical protein
MPTTEKLDPIIAAIENHQKLDTTWLDMERAADEAGLRTTKKRDLDRASAAAENAAWKMAKTEATTAAGCSAFLTYITTRPLTGLFELGETDWHETAFRTVAASLAKITGLSQRAA